jgi:hypothetical protein
MQGRFSDWRRVSWWLRNEPPPPDYDEAAERRAMEHRRYDSGPDIEDGDS